MITQDQRDAVHSYLMMSAIQRDINLIQYGRTAMQELQGTEFLSMVNELRCNGARCYLDVVLQFQQLADLAIKEKLVPSRLDEYDFSQLVIYASKPGRLSQCSDWAFWILAGLINRAFLVSAPAGQKKEAFLGIMGGL